MEELSKKMRELMEPAKEFIKKYKNLEEVPDNKVMQYMFDISAEDKNAIREFFGVSPEQFKIKDEKNVDIGFYWGEDKSPIYFFDEEIMENDSWEFESEEGDFSPFGGRYCPGSENLTVEDYELNNENLADLICILKIMQYQYATIEYEDLAEVNIDGDGIEYDSRVIDIQEILKCLGAERVNSKGEVELGLEIINREIAEYEKKIEEKNQIEEEAEEEEERRQEEKEKIEKTKIEELTNQISELMEPTKKFIKEYKKIDDISDDEVMKYMLEISAADKNAIREFFEVEPKQFSIKNGGDLGIDITWEEDCMPFRKPDFYYDSSRYIMGNSDWDFDSKCGDFDKYGYLPGYDRISMERSELNSENLADLICILKIMQYQYVTEEYEELADVYIYGNGIKYDSKVIDIQEILKCLEVERVIPEDIHDISEVQETISDRRTEQTNGVTKEIFDNMQEKTKENEQK